jgi:hypothetical protein
MVDTSVSVRRGTPIDIGFGACTLRYVGRRIRGYMGKKEGA